VTKLRHVAALGAVANASGMTSDLVAKAYDIYVNDKTGFFRKPVFDPEGAKTVLALRPSTACRRRP
jgi:hypothetical protein